MQMLTRRGAGQRFSHIWGRVVASLGRAFGILLIAGAALSSMNEILDASEAARHRPGNDRTIEGGISMLLISIARGVLTDIRYALREDNKEASHRFRPIGCPD
jgi:hypothetical protein